ncbi:MAG TPA: glycosyl hydrolase 115 family protein, partial [Longimicrobiales bacterium]
MQRTTPAAGLPARGRRGLVELLPAAFLLVLAPALSAQMPALGETTSYVTEQAASGRFPLFASGRAATLVVSSADWPGVVRAAKDLRADVGRVTGTEAPLMTAAAGTPPETTSPAVLIGTIGRSPLIDALVQARKLDVSGVAGKWETFVTQVVADPLPGVKQALVIAGSDKRGTIYGIYDLSAQIGVSPWYWWADVPAQHRGALYVLPGRHTQGEPAVKYRGIFLNDEAPALTGWAREKFGGMNHQVYEHVFELILRLKGNYLWPAMWGNAFNADDTLNPVLADEYGVVMGTSHHEPMLRAQQEWKRFGKGEWNYEHNDSTLRAFWADGIRHMGTHESIVTVGMRGDGDMPMTQGSNIALLERIVADQRKIIEQVTGKPASQTPQLWALYKEVQDYYDKGMRVPDDVTLLFSDDNWGDIRRLPSARDRNRAGGFGIYYHFDYVGGPRNYKWIDTNPIPRVWEQMRLAHEYGANRIWIVNVGDLKPMEYPISFFLDYAWSPERIPVAALAEYPRRWAAQQFGQEHAAEIGRVLATYHRYASRRKPELLDTATYSLTSYAEAERVIADWRTLDAQARSLEAQLPAPAHDAFYQLVLHPIEAYANLQDLYITVAKNRMYASMMQWRAATN